MSIHFNSMDVNSPLEPLFCSDYYNETTAEIERQAFQENPSFDDSEMNTDQNQGSLNPEVVTFAPIIGPPPAQSQLVEILPVIDFNLVDKVTLQLSKKRPSDSGLEPESNKRLRSAHIMETRVNVKINSKVSKYFFAPTPENASETVEAAPIENEKVELQREKAGDWARKKRTTKSKGFNADKIFVEKAQSKIILMNQTITSLKNQIIFHPNISHSVRNRTVSIWMGAQEKIVKYQNILLYIGISRLKIEQYIEIYKTQKKLSIDLKRTFAKNLRELQRFYNKLPPRISISDTLQ